MEEGQGNDIPLNLDDNNEWYENDGDKGLGQVRTYIFIDYVIAIR